VAFSKFFCYYKPFFAIIKTGLKSTLKNKKLSCIFIYEKNIMLKKITLVLSLFFISQFTQTASAGEDGLVGTWFNTPNFGDIDYNWKNEFPLIYKDETFAKKNGKIVEEIYKSSQTEKTVQILLIIPSNSHLSLLEQTIKEREKKGRKFFDDSETYHNKKNNRDLIERNKIDKRVLPEKQVTKSSNTGPETHIWGKKKVEKRSQ
jgi:hypothetical protein